MANTITSPNMLLPVPVVGVDPGPDWANNINNCLTIIDAHNHTSNEGVQVPTDGININADLPFNGFNSTGLRSSRYVPQGSPLSLPADLSCVYVSGVDLWFNDANGDQIRLTQGGAVAGTPGSITNLVPPAAVTYSPPDQTFTFTSAPNTPANGDFGYINLRNFVLNSHALTLQAPPSMPADYSITLPELPVAKSIMQIDTSGVISDNLTPDGTTISIISNQLVAQAGGLISGPGLIQSGNTIALAPSVQDERSFTANGEYAAATSFPQNQVDGYFFFPYNATITSIWIFNLTPGGSGTTEFDLKLASSGGSFSSILSTTGKIDSTASSNVWTDSNSVISPQTGVTKPVLSTTNINAGQALRFDLLQSMAIPAADCGVIVYFFPR